VHRYRVVKDGEEMYRIIEDLKVLYIIHTTTTWGDEEEEEDEA